MRHFYKIVICNCNNSNKGVTKNVFTEYQRVYCIQEPLPE
jgi:hypothetical protein